MPDDEFEIEQIIIEYGIKLIKHWITIKVIDGIQTLQGSCKDDKFEEVDDWLHPVRVIIRKKSTIIHIMIAVYTELSTYQLYDKAKEICEKFNISASSKQTIMEYTKRIGMISGPYVKLASTIKYNETLNNHIDIESKLLETRKQIVYEKNMKSKIIVVYAVEKHVNELDLQLVKMQSTTFQYISFKHSGPEERIAAMHANELINVKARYETLYNVNTEMRI